MNQQARAVHARWHDGDDALCGEPMNDRALKLVLTMSRPDARLHREKVSCADCLEWLHA